MRNLLTLLFCLFSLLTTPAQTYYLPKTAVRLHLLIERQTYEPGCFAPYAKRYLQLDGIRQQQRVSHRVTDIQLTTLGVRDTSKCYTLQLKTKGEAPDIRLSDDAVLLAINAEPLPAATPPTHAILGGQPVRTAPDPKTLLSAEALAAGSTAKQAELTAQQITELRERRQLLITGEADDMPQDERQLQRMLSEIDRQCDLLTMLFTGTTRRDTTAHTVTLCPDSETEREVIFRLSRTLGLVDKDDMAGVPYYLTLKNLHPAEQPLLENKKGEGICVNIPATVQLTILQEDLPLATFEVPLAQFGITALRDGSVFRSKSRTHLQLHPATGAVVRMYTDAE